MRLTGLHLLLTYECNFECDHCFVWSGPRQSGTMTVEQIDDILHQAKDTETIEWIYFEGGEPVLYYALLRYGVRQASKMGFRVGVVSNAYWATGPGDALECLRDLAGSVQDLAMSCDGFHGDDEQIRHVQCARKAARALHIPTGTIAVAESGTEAKSAVGQLPEGESGVMHRGRAAEKLAPLAPKRRWSEMTECPYEDLREPGRVHVDPFGNLHICQGISIGNLFQRPLREICASYNPVAHPITGPLHEGGPVELADRYGVAHSEGYADACHFCYETRRALRPRFPEVLIPDQMYGCPGS
jgi:MoaA/NifB/PqqE/SkfB family radical SAM enzyme